MVRCLKRLYVNTTLSGYVCCKLMYLLSSCNTITFVNYTLTWLQKICYILILCSYAAVLRFSCWTTIYTLRRNSSWRPRDEFRFVLRSWIINEILHCVQNFAEPIVIVRDISDIPSRLKICRWRRLQLFTASNQNIFSSRFEMYRSFVRF
jgi:hypothetical protein